MVVDSELVGGYASKLEGSDRLMRRAAEKKGRFGGGFAELVTPLTGGGRNQFCGSGLRGLEDLRYLYVGVVRKVCNMLDRLETA